MVGAGQLARMTHQAAIALGVELVVLSQSHHDPAVGAGASWVAGSPENLEDLIAIARRCDVMTFDHELVPLDHVLALQAKGFTLRPAPHALHLTQDKAAARRTLQASGFPVPAFAEIDRGDRAALERFAGDHGWPIAVKAPVGGYDGRGVAIATGIDDPALAGLPTTRSWLLEQHVMLERELAVLLARRPSGELVTYPVIETVQRDGICRELVMPARVNAAVEREALEIATSLACALDVVGIMAVELFLATDGTILVNEMATRPHNSGHATIDGTVCSQFENHLRAVLDWPLGSTELVHPATATVNVLGPSGTVDFARTLPRALELPDVRVHLYAKEPRPGRKLGHVTASAEDPETALRRARHAAATLLGAAS